MPTRKTPPLALFYRIVYGSSYTFLMLVLLVLLMVSPGDIINQARLRHNVYPILIVSICYISAVGIAGFVYVLRLYINRSVLNSIPKAWIPVEKGDVKRRVRRMIAAGLGRSAAVAWAGQPRTACAAVDDKDGAERGPRDYSTLGDDGEDGPRAVRQALLQERMGIDLPPLRPVWGAIAHPGWAPPAAGDDLAHLQYGTVVAELPNLIEAKAMTLAPTVAALSASLSAPMLAPPTPSDATHEPPITIDPDAAALLQRPPYMGLRDYLAHLAALGVLDIGGEEDVYAGDDAHAHGSRPAKDGRPLGTVVTSFLSAYEYARFSTQMLTQDQFRQLMHDLATLLRRMTPLDPDRLLDDDDDNDDDDDRQYAPSINSAVSVNTGNYSTPSTDIDNNAARSTPTTPRSRSRSTAGRLDRPDRLDREDRLDRFAGLSHRLRPHADRLRSSSPTLVPARNSTDHHGRRPTTAATAATAGTSTTMAALSVPTSRSSSVGSFRAPHRSYPASQRSNASLRSTASSGSVIRLAAHGDTSSLPYVLLPISGHRP